MAQKTYRDAIREALREEMLRDENVPTAVPTIASSAIGVSRIRLSPNSP